MCVHVMHHAPGVEGIRPVRVRLAPLIRALREREERSDRRSLPGFGSQLFGLSPAEWEAVEALPRGIVAKRLHDPIVRLKEAPPSEAPDRDPSPRLGCVDQGDYADRMTRPRAHRGSGRTMGTDGTRRNRRAGPPP